MAFINIGAGLSEMGKTVAATAGAWTLQAQRDEADLEKAKVIDQLMAARESTGRRETHVNAMEQQGERLKAEAPEREARVASLRSGTGLAEDKARREREAGEGVSGIIVGGGGKGGSYSSSSYGERLAGYEGGTKKGGMVDNELGSGAHGPYQFMPGTWGDVRKSAPELNLPEDMRAATKEQHKAAFDKFTATNAETLQKAGFEPTAANLYLAHRFGAGGAQALLRADDGKLLSDVLPADWQKQNPDMRGQTVAGFKRLAEERMKGVTLDAATGGGKDDGMPADMRASLAALAKADPKDALLMKQRWDEQRRLEEQNTKSAAKVQIGDEGIAYVINPITRKVEPLTVDGAPLKFRDPDVAKAQTELIRTYSTQLADASRAYVPQILASEATIRTLEKDPMLSMDKEKQGDLAQAKGQAKMLRERYEAERKPLMDRLSSLGAQLSNKVGAAPAPEAPPVAPPPPPATLRYDNKGNRIKGLGKSGLVNETVSP